MSQSRQRVLSDLQSQLYRFEQGQRSNDSTVLSTGVAELDILLSGKGLRRGSVVEWLAASDGCGALSLALSVAHQACRQGGALVVIDPRRELYPPGIDDLGIDLERLLIVRPDTPQDCVWALDQSLRCQGVATVVGWVTHLDSRTFRRLQLSAEAGNGLGLLIRPAEARHEPSWAATRLFVEPLPSPIEQRFRVELLRNRGGRIGGTVDLEIDDETGAVRLAAELAHPASAG